MTLFIIVQLLADAAIAAYFVETRCEVDSLRNSLRNMAEAEGLAFSEEKSESATVKIWDSLRKGIPDNWKRAFLGPSYSVTVEKKEIK